MPDIGLSLNTNLRQQQELQITPAQLQRLEILQATSQELQLRVNQALMQNPLLEQLNQPLTVSEGQVLQEADQRTPGPEEIRAARDLDGDAQEYRAEVAALAAESPPEQIPSYDANGEEIPAGEVEEPEYRELRGTADEGPYPMARNPEAEERRQYFFDSLTTEDGFYTKLLQQVSELKVSPSMRELCAKLVGELDADGYLRHSDEELAAQYGLPPRRIHQAVRALQKLDPPGIAAHDLRECLLLQLAAQRLVHSLEWDIVDRHLEKVAKNRIPEIAKAIDADVEETQEAILRIRQLNPAPGHELFFEIAPYIHPDVFVESTPDGGLSVRMNHDTVPMLVLNRDNVLLLEDSGTDSETRRYVTQKIGEASQLIEAIEQRQKTIEKIALVLLEMQPEFFRTGREADLRPLTLSKVAERLELSEGTVSRAISNKYMRTPWGVRSFKNFFSFGYRTSSGEEVSSLKVRQRLRELVEEEDGRHPLSDQALSDQLKKEGYSVERRTIAKYRDLDHIPTSSLRKIH
ncbi:MAG: RNA polymerase factor sigma-54 [Victivallales bacterium]|nr:RNA polymerase factor sigma-54 [Victivallales bacterium]